MTPRVEWMTKEPVRSGLSFEELSVAMDDRLPAGRRWPPSRPYNPKFSKQNLSKNRVLSREFAFQKPSKAVSYSRVKKTKVKSTRRRASRNGVPKVQSRAPYPKAALRSEAFARAILDAKSYASSNDRLKVLFNEVSEKMASISKEPFKDSWAYLQAMLRLVRAYSRGEYRAVSQESLLSVVAALNYLIDPFDLIPDEVPFLGFIDDATVIAFAIRSSKDDLDDFMTWEMVAPYESDRVESRS